MSNAAILRAMERIVTLTSDAAPGLEVGVVAAAPGLVVGRVYSIPAGDVKRTAYYICESANDRQAIFGLKPPNDILAWLMLDDSNCIGNTPQNLMAARFESDVSVVASANPTIVDSLFIRMKALLFNRNNKEYEDDQKRAKESVEEYERDNAAMRPAAAAAPAARPAAAGDRHSPSSFDLKPLKSDDITQYRIAHGLRDQPY
jgi:hypothetical protein